MPDFPPELAQGTRQPDQDFDGNEQLFRRFPPDYGSDPDVDAVELPDISVCRGKYSRPEHVLCSSHNAYAGWGVLQFRVKDVPRSIKYAGYDACHSRVVHVPFQRNYAHTEIRLFDVNDNHLDKATISRLDKDVNLRFRQKILEYAVVCIAPAARGFADR